jgi:hypothetical protein
VSDGVQEGQSGLYNSYMIRTIIGSDVMHEGTRMSIYKYCERCGAGGGMLVALLYHQANEA